MCVCVCVCVRDTKFKKIFFYCAFSIAAAVAAGQVAAEACRICRRSSRFGTAIEAPLYDLRYKLHKTESLKKMKH